MRRFLIVLAVLAWGGTAGAWGLDGLNFGFGFGFGSGSGGGPVFQAPLSRPGLIPSDLVCTDGSPAVPALRCFVPPGEDRWACFDRDGAEVPVTQGTGTTYEDEPWGRAARIDAQEKIPSLTTAGLFDGPYTAVVIFNGEAAAVDTTYRRILAEKINVMYRQSSSRFYCGSGPGGVGERFAPYNRGWVVGSCRWDGTTITARVNGESNSLAYAAAPSYPATDLMFGGDRTTNMDGMLAHVSIYDCALTDDSLASYEAQVYGTRASDGRIAATPYPGAKWCDGGYQVGDNAPCLDASGMESRRAVLNYWTNSTNPGAWDLNGTPTVSGNTVTDNDAAAFQGVVSNTTPAQDGAWVSTCYVSAGTATSARMMTHSTGGTGGAVCDFHGLTAEPQRLTCAAANIAGGTVVTGRIYVGNQSTVTGSVVVHQCQLEKASFPGRRCDAGESPTTCPGDVASVPISGIPPGAEVCATIEPFACIGDGQVILDTRGADGEGIVLYLDQECHLALDAAWPVPMTVSDSTPVPIGEPTEVCWRLSPGFQVRRDGVPSATLSTAIFAHGETLWIGVDKDGGHQLEGRIKDVEVRR